MTSATSSRYADLADRRVIFCINSGRSGSKYLAQLLGTATGVKSFHEAEPKMNAEFIRTINDEPLAASRERRRIKAAAIAEVLRGARPEEIYAETNHTFIKTFFDVVLEEFRNPDVIILRRDVAHVLKSFIELGYFSPRNPLSYEWMSSPNAVTAALRPLAPDSELDQFDLCIAYLFDIEARAVRFKKEYPWVRTHDVRLEELNSRSSIAEVFRRLHLTPTEATRELCGQRTNERQARKDRVGAPTTLEQCHERLAQYVARARAAGIEIPATAALDNVDAR